MVRNELKGRPMNIRPRDKQELNYVVDLSDRGGKHVMYVHRLVALAFIPNPRGCPFVDHINRDPKDNRVENLRWCFPQENACNARKWSGKRTSSYKGVIRRTGQQVYRARIRFHDKLINIGSYRDEIEAAKAYDSKARELFGEFACCNFPCPSQEDNVSIASDDTDNSDPSHLDPLAFGMYDEDLATSKVIS